MTFTVRASTQERNRGRRVRAKVGSCAAAALAVLAVGASPSLAATYYVSGSGSDTNPGTLSQPFRSLTTADNAAAAGDTIYVRAGTYGASGVQTVLAKSGTTASRITWLGYPGDSRPVVRGALKLIGSRVRFSGFLLSGATGPIGMSAAEDAKAWIEGSTSAEFDHNEITGGLGQAGLYVSDATGVSIHENSIHDNGVSDQFDQGIYAGSGSGSIVNNVVDHNRAYGIQLYPDATGWSVNHNTVVRNQRGGVILADNAANNTITNNIVANNGEWGIRGLGLTSTGTGNSVTRNLVYNQSPNLDAGGSPSTNIAFSQNIVADPAFAGTNDFHLLATSPARDAALGTPPSADFDGVARTSPADLGAFEYVAPAPELRSSSSSTANAATAISFAKPTGAAQGDVLVAQVVNQGSGAISPPTGWTSIRDTTVSGAHAQTFYRVASATEPASYSFSSTNAFGKAGGIMAWRNVSTTSPIMASSGNTGTGTTVAATGLTTTAGNAALVFAAGVFDSASLTPPRGLVERWDLASAGTYKATAETATAVQAAAGATGSKTAVATSAGGGWTAQLIALRPAP